VLKKEQTGVIASDPIAPPKDLVGFFYHPVTSNGFGSFRYSCVPGSEIGL